MSISQMKMVFEDKKLNPTRKLIMLALADNANDTGVCFPSINTIKDKTNLSTGAVNDNLKYLSKNGYLFKKNRSRKKGGRSSNKYLIYPFKNRAILDEDDYLIFEDLYSQIPTDGLPPQIPTDGQGSDSQIPTDGQESEPSLKSFNHHLHKKDKKKFSFTLKKNVHYSKLSQDYKDKLFSKILLLDNAENYEDFILALESNEKYKYMDFSKVYMKWYKVSGDNGRKIKIQNKEWIEVIHKGKPIAINPSTYEAKEGKFRQQQGTHQITQNRPSMELVGNLAKGVRS